MLLPDAFFTSNSYVRDGGGCRRCFRTSRTTNWCSTKS